MVLKMQQSVASGIRQHVNIAPARPVVPVLRTKQSPAKRLSTVMRIAELERTAEEDALMFCYQVRICLQAPS